MGEGQEMELERWAGPIGKGLRAVLSFECPGSGVDLLSTSVYVLEDFSGRGKEDGFVVKR